MTRREPVVLSWSGGKDSALALHALHLGGSHEVVGLLTTVSQEHRRISHHGVRDELLQSQAEAIGLPLQRIWLPSGPSHGCTNADYERRMEEALTAMRRDGIDCIAHGDIFLEDLRAYRERNLARVGMRGVFPLWKRDTRELLREFVTLRFRAHVVCVDGRKLPREFAGRPLDASWARDLPDSVDPCGENGEYHSFVWDGPVFRRPVPVQVGEVVERDVRFFADLLPADAGAAAEQMPRSNSRPGRS